MFLLRSSIKHIQNVLIKINFILLHHLLVAKLLQWNQSYPENSLEKLTKKKLKNYIKWLKCLREPVSDQRRLRDSSSWGSLIWMMLRVSPFSSKLSIAHLRANLLPFEKSKATPMLLLFVAILKKKINLFRVFQSLEIQESKAMQKRCKKLTPASDLFHCFSCTCAELHL